MDGNVHEWASSSKLRGFLMDGNVHVGDLLEFSPRLSSLFTRTRCTVAANQDNNNNSKLTAYLLTPILTNFSQNGVFLRLMKNA